MALSFTFELERREGQKGESMHAYGESKVKEMRGVRALESLL